MHSGLRSEVDRDVEDGLERLADRFLRRPPGQSFGFVIQDDDFSLDIGRNHTIADGAQRHGQAFFLRRDLLLETPAFGHIAHHRDVEFLFVDLHLAERNFEGKANELAGASQRKCGTASPFGHFLPGAWDRLRVRFASVRFRNEFCEFIADHFLIAIAEHFFSRRIHRTNHALLVQGDHSVENILNDRSNPSLDVFQLHKLPADEHETITV